MRQREAAGEGSGGRYMGQWEESRQRERGGDLEDVGAG